MSCPSRADLLDMWESNEEIPHLDECEDCADYLEKYFVIDDAFGGRPEQFQLAVQELIDETFEDVPPKEWAAQLARDRELQHGFIAKELLKRAIAARENPSVSLDLTAAAVAVCDGMEEKGEPRAQLFFDVLKERAMALRAAGDLDGAFDALGRAWAVTDALENREQLHAVLSLCTALTYSEADSGKFDEAVTLAEGAHGVLERWGDHRRALMANQTKAYALMQMRRYVAALPLALATAEQQDAMGWRYDAAISHQYAAICYVALGVYDEALGHALVAQCGFEQAGNAVTVARAAHEVARATAGLGRFEEARAQFEDSAEVIFSAGLYETWVLNRLDYVTAALRHDPAADVRGDVETIACVCLMLGRENSTMRRQYAAEALDYLRRLAKRDELTVKAADYVRDFVALNASRPPVRFRPPERHDLVN